MIGSKNFLIWKNFHPSSCSKPKLWKSITFFASACRHLTKHINMVAKWAARNFHLSIQSAVVCGILCCLYAIFISEVTNDCVCVCQETFLPNWKKNVNHVEEVHTLTHTCDIHNLICPAFAKEVQIWDSLQHSVFVLNLHKVDTRLLFPSLPLAFQIFVNARCLKLMAVFKESRC